MRGTAFTLRGRFATATSSRAEPNIITGGDRLPAEYKYADCFEFDSFVRLVFSANNPPRSEDSSPAFFDRWLVVPFDRTFRGERREIPADVLDARLSTPSDPAPHPRFRTSNSSTA